MSKKYKVRADLKDYGHRILLAIEVDREQQFTEDEVKDIRTRVENFLNNNAGLAK